MRTTLVCGVVLWLVAAAAAVSPAARGELRADELVLVVNKNVKESRELAEFYVNARHVPDDRICVLDLPFQDEITSASFDADVAPVVRNFLRDRHLEGKVKCLVPFYGIPLRIGDRIATLDEAREKDRVNAELQVAQRMLRGLVWTLEDKWKAQDPKYLPAAGDDAEGLKRRFDVVLPSLLEAAQRQTDPALRLGAVNDAVDAVRRAQGAAGVAAMFHNAGASLTPEQRDAYAKLEEQARKDAAEREALVHKGGADARKRLREMARPAFGLFEEERILSSQHALLETSESGAALDSELSLLWAADYGRWRWQPNLLNYRVPAEAAARANALMVVRLDAPEPALVRTMILDGLKTERDGPSGGVVFDSRGIHGHGKDAEPGSYAWYDQTLRDASELLSGRTKLTVMLDEKPTLIPAGGAKDVFMYCGWYSLRNYVPSCAFSRGAVAFHVASSEMVSLHNPGERGWAANLLKNGVVATLGPVAEPYAGSFPTADDFFPLLATGRLTFAEVYWATTPMSSWMQCAVGDPLYTPCRGRPALALGDLPPRLAPAIKRFGAESADARGD